MTRFFNINRIYNCAFLIVLTANQMGIFSMKNTEEEDGNHVSRKLNIKPPSYGIHASFKISSYPTSSTLDIPHAIQTRPKRFPRVNRKPSASKGRKVVPQFEDANGTTVIGSPGGSITISCNIFMLQDFTVS